MKNHSSAGTQNTKVHYLSGLLAIQRFIVLAPISLQNVTLLDVFHLHKGCWELSVICSVN